MITASDATPILFLDFDGVLHPGSGVDSGFLCRAPDLEEALSGHDLRIVVSSSWRLHMERDEILGMLPQGFAQRVVGATGDAHIGRWPPQSSASLVSSTHAVSSPRPSQQKVGLTLIHPSPRRPGSGGPALHERPFWIAQALKTEDAAPAAPLLEDTRTGLCIVGGGFTGLWTAILAKQMRPDLDIVLIEADVCGGGASGRNGGCVSTWSTKFFTLQRLFGDAEAARLVRASEKTVIDIEEFCAGHGIDCEWRRHGTLFTATSRAQIGASDAVMAALAQRDICSWTRLGTEEVQRRAGSRAHLEGWFSPVAATLHPGKLVRGLRRVAMNLGVRVYEHTPMLQIEHGTPAAVRTPQGRVRADSVVIAINAWMASTFREFGRTIAIVSSDMVITEPAPAQLAATGLDGGISVMDSRTFVHYYRSTADGRLMLGKGGNTFAFGGRMLRVFDEPSPYRELLGMRLREFMPQLAGVPLAASWNGPSDRSVTGLPFFGRLQEARNVFYGFGYSGNGVGPSHIGGTLLASLALGQDNEWTRSPLARGPLGKFPPEPLRYAGSILVRNAIRRKERAEDAGGQPSALDTRLSQFAAAAGKADKG